MAEGDILVRRGDEWLAFTSPVDIVSATAPDDVIPAVDRIEQASREGLTAVGFLAYESSSAFDAALPARELPGFPLAWFGLYKGADIAGPPVADAPYALGEWRPTITQEKYDRDVARIKSYIESGDTYQVNFTFRLNAEFSGDPRSLFADMCRAQNAPYEAFIDCGSHVICSATPELFFERKNRHVVSRPMKGTSPRGRTLAEDRELMAALRTSKKNRSENVMIVDMIRNDLGRVADAGSVRVTSAYDIEQYPTVLQMTSTVEADTDASLRDLLSALFPCASITGAPKVHTMEIIRELETTPRGVYCGAIGIVSPEREALFSVVIRTVVIDREQGVAEYGTGGGIVWDSDPAGEYEESLTKAGIVREPYPDFELLETLLWTPDEGYVLLEHHLARLLESRQYFGYDALRDDLCDVLAAAVRGEDAPRRVRLLFGRDGQVRVETHPFDPGTGAPWRVAVCTEPVSSANRFLYHKTTVRGVYERARASRPDCDDVILVNERGEVTEATVANVIVLTGGQWYTPPVSSGLLAGTRRKEMLARGDLVERVLTPDDLAAADELMLVNSVRGKIPCVLVP